MKTLKQFIKEDCNGSVAEASRKLAIPRGTIERWFNKKKPVAPSLAYKHLLEDAYQIKL